MKYDVNFTSQFKKDLKLAKKQNKKALYKNKLEIPDPYNYKYPGSLSKKY